MRQHETPPRWLTTLLRKFGHPGTMEEVEGDLAELYEIWRRQYGERKANQKYAWTVLTLFRPFTKERNYAANGYSLSIQYFMIRNFFVMSWRTLAKNKVSSIINISGLTLGLTTSILVMLLVMDELGYDQFHANLSDVYLLMKNQKTNDGVGTGRSTAGTMKEALLSGFPEVKYVSRMAGFDGQQVLIDSSISYESGVYADPDFFRMLTFPSRSGQAANALEGDAVVITELMAKKLFGDKSPLGKTIVFDRTHTLMIGAVVENIPSKSSITFDMVVPFSVYEKQNEWLKKWDDNRILTWMLLQPNVDLASFNDKVTRLLQAHTGDKGESLFAYPLESLHLHGSFSNGYPNGGKITAVYILIGFGVFMLTIACINFMNVATAQSEHRAREVGVRKVLGASRKWIVIQFLNESFIMTFMSLTLAISFALLIIPSFNTLTHSSIRFDSNNITAWGIVVGIGLITALLAGSYPSLFLSKFQPARVLKGPIANLKGHGLRSWLVTFQFCFSVFFLIGTIVLYAQFDYVRNRPIGYEQANLIDVQLDGPLSKKFTSFKDELATLSNIRSITGASNNILYAGGAVTGMDWPGKHPEEDLAVCIGSVDYDWTKTMGIRIIEGRDFDLSFASDSSACLINESAVAKMGLKDPVGAVVGGHSVVGVFQDFVFNNPSGSIAPMAVYLNPKDINHLYLRVQNNSSWRQTLDEVEKIARKFSLDYPLEFSFTSEEYQSRFAELSDMSLIVSIFGGMTIFISCLGLFGLSGFVAERRSKEMSIRKVFGASMSRVLISLSRDFLRPVFYAMILVIPITVLIAQWALSNISYRVPLRWWMFTSGAAATIFFASIIVLYHGWRTARENPIVRLRNE